MKQVNLQEIRKTIPTNIQLPNEFILSSCSNSPTFVTSCIKIETHQKVIYIDPYLLNDTTPADYILITHPHPDHYSPVDIEKVIKEDTQIFCPQYLEKDLSKYSIHKVKPGDITNLGDIKCKVVSAYNNWFPFHPKFLKIVGYVLSINGLQVYHAGDTDYISEMKQLKGITIALVPIGIGPLAMNPKQAAEAIKEMNPSIAIPMHYRIGKQSAEKFSKLLVNETRVIILE
jgi:L-ascorbate metabolism protein UlaG (beta-lactamase superfamily)